jgi:signal transduction histidine kinase
MFVLIATIFVSIIAAYFIYNNRQRKKQNAILLITKTELEEAIVKLNKTNLELQHSNSTKDKFFSIIAHDLKNPFGTLLGATNILKLDDGTMDEVDKKELIDIISSDTEKLYALLENLLFWASSQTKKLKAKKSTIQLSLLASEISELLKSNAKSKNINLNIEVPESLFVYFDEFMLSTILRNLITNAIKFSYHDASISIVGFEENDKIHLKITDYGIGISEENQTHIFDESSDFKQNGTDKEKGTGLGLILCRDFVKENNAQILLTSKLNEGTTFELVMEKAIL